MVKDIEGQENERPLIFIGRNIDDERASGDVIFVSGAHYNFDVDGNVVIDNGEILDSRQVIK